MVILIVHPGPGDKGQLLLLEPFSPRLGEFAALRRLLLAGAFFAGPALAVVGVLVLVAAVFPRTWCLFILV